jgi:hypothetical protein
MHRLELARVAAKKGAYVYPEEVLGLEALGKNYDVAFTLAFEALIEAGTSETKAKPIAECVAMELCIDPNARFRSCA